MSTPGSPPIEPAGRFEKKLLRVTKLERFVVEPRWVAAPNVRGNLGEGWTARARVALEPMRAVDASATTS